MSQLVFVLSEVPATGAAIPNHCEGCGAPANAPESFASGRSISYTCGASLGQDETGAYLPWAPCPRASKETKLAVLLREFEDDVQALAGANPHLRQAALRSLVLTAAIRQFEEVAAPPRDHALCIVEGCKNSRMGFYSRCRAHGPR